MLFEIRQPSGDFKKIQLDSHPQCGLFSQQLLSSPGSDRPTTIRVSYNKPKDSDGDTTDAAPLEVPLEPDLSSLDKISVALHRSETPAYRMGDTYDAWFSACFGLPVMLVYIGDGRRAVLGTSMLPPTQTQAGQESDQKTGWFSSVTSYLPAISVVAPQSQRNQEDPWITFTDVAPFLITSESSLREVSSRLPVDEPMPMYKFRPNIVLDGAGEDAWAEDFWAELAVGPSPGGGDNEKLKLHLTGNCGRCTSLNVDYTTGKPAVGELGSVLKKLMADRRVDAGSRWSPVFGRYAFLGNDGGGNGGDGLVCLRVGDEVAVTKRNVERSVWDWPLK
jgi:uncharacterized protein YcbX